MSKPDSPHADPGQGIHSSHGIGSEDLKMQNAHPCEDCGCTACAGYGQRACAVRQVCHDANQSLRNR